MDLRHGVLGNKHTMRASFVSTVCYAVEPGNHVIRADGFDSVAVRNVRKATVYHEAPDTAAAIEEPRSKLLLLVLNSLGIPTKKIL